MRALGVCGGHLGRQEQEQERCRRHVVGVTPPTRLSRHCSTLSASSSLQLLSQHHTSHLTTNHRHLLNTSFYSYSYRNY